MKYIFILANLLGVFYLQELKAQFISLNGVYVSVGSNTVINADTITNNSSTLANEGTLNLFTINNAATIQGSGIYNISKNFINTGTFTANSSTVHFNATSDQSIPAVTFYHFITSGSGTTKTAAGNINVNGDLTIDNGVTVDMLTYSLGGSPGTVSGTGVLKTQNTSITPVPSGKTWTTDVEYNSVSAQTIVNGNYNNLMGSGGNRTIDSNGTVGIAGIFTPGGGSYAVKSSTINFNGSADQTIPAFTFNNITLTGSNTKNAGGTINIKGDLTLSNNTTLALGSNTIYLKSDSNYTARVATMPATASITYGTGRFVAERYILGRRKYRLMTSAVTTSPNATLTTGEEALSIWGNWQNQANNSTPNVGTFITGGSAADGYDQQTPNASMFTYNGSTRFFEGFTTANGKNTKYTPLKAGVPYFMFVYGDRTNSAITSNPNVTVLKATGKLLTGDQVYNTGSSIPLSNTAGEYTMIGNPFASPIDWSTISRTNIGDSFWGWDPNLSSTGGYVTVNTVGDVTLISPFSGSVGLDQYIQSGQGFFVQTTAASPVLTIKETDKVNNYNKIAFRTEANSIPLMAVNLLYTDAGGTKLMDGALAAFDTSFSNLLGKEDAAKILKTGENLSMECQHELLSINARKLPENSDTILLNMTSITKPQYILQIFTKKLESSALEPYLEDTYLNTSRLLSLTDTNYIPFDINTTIPASIEPNRFHIVFRKSGDLADIITSIKAEKQNRQVLVSWDVSSEAGIQKYEVQRAADGNGFSKIGEVAAGSGSGAQHYEWIDDNPVTGMNQYRIRLKHADGSTALSKTVTVTLTEEKPEMKIYPNPVQDYQVNIKLTNLAKGKYSVQLIDMKGQLVMVREIEYNGGTGSVPLLIDRQNVTGIYYLQLSDKKTKLIQKIMIR